MSAIRSAAWLMGACAAVLTVVEARTPSAPEELASTWQPPLHGAVGQAALPPGDDPIVFAPTLANGASFRMVGSEQPDGAPVRVDLRDFSPRGNGKGYIENLRSETHGHDIDIGASDAVSVDVTRSPMSTRGGTFRVRTEGDASVVSLRKSPIDTSK